MALTSNGLTDIGMGPGFTTNFHVQYDDTLASVPNAIARANALLGSLENEFNVLTGWFNTPAGSFGSGHRITVNLNKPDGSGANNNGYGGQTINLDAQNSNSNAANANEIVRMLFVAEWSEVLMDLTGTWNRGDSNGEGLSQYATIQRAQTGHYLYYGSWVNQWLNQHPRQDWVNTTEGTDGNAISFGCSLCFLYYLNTQLGFTINQIIAAGASTLTGIYHTLTGDSGNPFPFFSGLLEHVFPSSATASIPGPNFDNPFPLAEMSFWVDKSTFGKGEVEDVIATSGGTFFEAFWLVVEGFSANSFNSLGVTIPAPTGPFAGIAAISRDPLPIDFENAANPRAPQRIRIAYDITFTGTSAFPASGNIERELDALLTVGGAAVPGSRAATIFELVAGADPYFTNVDPAQNNVFYLSQDLRVFTGVPAQNSHPVAGAPAFATDSVAGAFTYIQQLLTHLNTNFSNPAGPDPFNTILPAQAAALTGDSSVTPFTFDFSNPFNPRIYNNYNFAVARVRLRGPSGPSGAAPNVRVFFRLWSTETADTDYQVSSTYNFTPDAAGLPGSPLVGTDHHTLPFFATGDLATNSDYNSGGVNNQNLQINSGDSLWAYYGCFLNLYDANNKIDGQQVQHWLNGTHHCIVAQIAYDDAPIINSNGITMSPENSDKLAQRNLQVTHSDNPGPASAHRIPQTFDIRPSAPLAKIGGDILNYPDELMIDWGAIPSGSVASIYWPQVSAADVIALASQLYGSHTLTAADPNTVQCTVTRGVTYIPVPTGTGANFAGLFTVDLPLGVVAGQEFNIVVRRVATRRLIDPVIQARTSAPPSSGKPDAAAVLAGEPGAAAVIVRRPPNWRYVVGTFQVKIPVATRETLLFPEENTLAIMKWRLQQMSPTNRWYKVLERYVSYIAGRVEGLGGDPNSIQPSPNGVPPVAVRPCEDMVEHTGVITKVCYDCFGRFQGFQLADCCDYWTYHSCEPHVGDLALRCLEARLRVAVYTLRDKPGTVHKLCIVS